MCVRCVFVVVVEKCDVAPATQQLPAPVATATPMYRQMSPCTVVNLSQRSHHSTSLTGVPPLPVAGGSAGLAQSASAVATSQSAVLHSVRPATTQAITVCAHRQLSFNLTATHGLLFILSAWWQCGAEMLNETKARDQDQVLETENETNPKPSRPRPRPKFWF